MSLNAGAVQGPTTSSTTQSGGAQQTLGSMPQGTMQVAQAQRTAPTAGTGRGLEDSVRTQGSQRTQQQRNEQPSRPQQPDNGNDPQRRTGQQQAPLMLGTGF